MVDLHVLHLGFSYVSKRGGHTKQRMLMSLHRAACKYGDSQVVPASDEMIGEMAGSILQNEVIL